MLRFSLYSDIPCAPQKYPPCFKPIYVRHQTLNVCGFCHINHGWRVQQPSAPTTLPSPEYFMVLSTCLPPWSRFMACSLGLLSWDLVLLQVYCGFFSTVLSWTPRTWISEPFILWFDMTQASMSNHQLITQFTEDAIAQEDRPCGRTNCASGGIIRKGEPAMYVASIDATRPGRFVCYGCFHHYLKAPSTSTRPSTNNANNNALHAQQAGLTLSNVTAVQHAVSAAQRKSTVQPPAVMPMPPVTGSSHTSHPIQPSTSTGPLIFHPSMRSSHIPPASVASSSSPSQGYGPQHALYDEARQYWLSKAYNVPPPAAPPRLLRSTPGPLLPSAPPSLASLAQTITFNITALHEGGASRKSRIHGMPFGNICEGKRDIDAHITAPETVAIALDLVVPRIQAFNPKFKWRVDEFAVRDEDWVDLSKHNNPYEAFFYKRCLVQAAGGRKSKGLVFKSHSFTLHVVVPAQQWSEYEVFVDSDQGESASTSPTISHGNHSRPYASRISIGSEQSLFPESGQPLAKTKPLGVARTRTTKADSNRLFLSAPTSSHSSLPPPPTVQPDSDLFTSTSPPVTKSQDISPTTIKRGHAQSSSVSSITTQSPPSKRLVTGTSTGITTVAIQSCSPDRDRLRDALRSGGDANLDVTDVMKLKRELVEFYPIPTFSIKEILDDPEKRAFDIHSAILFPGQVRINGTPAGLIGVGGFKTTQLAQLLLGTLRSSGIGSQVCQDIVVKRFYIRKSAPDNNAKLYFNRLAVSDELEKLYREANILYWAKSLFQLTYNFIDRAVAKAAIPPPFEIPRLRFVDAGLLLAVKSSSVKAPSAVNVQTPYLAEELIPEDEPFVKYIHNGEPTPLPEKDEPGYDTAQFLAFTQHVQYVKTGGLAYITDYQGSGTLLTDPQILTHPSVSAGKELFGEGNLEIGVKLFATEHVCNQFCKWPGFELATPGSILDISM